MDALAYAKDPKYHGKTKHIQIRYHFVREMITQNEVVLKHIPTNEMVADPFTKSIARDAFVRHVRSLGLCRICHTPIHIRPNWRIRIESGARDYILGLSLTCSFIRAELVPVGIQTVSVITRIIYIYKRTTTGVVSIKIYTHILSPIYLYKHLYLYMSNTKHQRLQKQCGEHISLS